MTTLAVLGLGYVGLPLAVEFGKHFPTIGVDESEEKIRSYKAFVDPIGELSGDDLRASTQLRFTTDMSALAEADVILVAVPTPVDLAHQPDLGPLVRATKAIGRHMKDQATVVYESTVYPGATEEVCIPFLERESGRTWKKGFFVGYSPERINPGDPEHSFTNVTKIVSGDTPETLERIASIYGKVLTAGLHRASSIKVAEAAKVIENTQRDLNIALINELAMIFHRIGIDTLDVLEAAGTKWNFLPFRPGLVGGHCIGVDPFYLTHKADMLGYHPQVILAGRRINDSMGTFIAEQTVKLLISRERPAKGSRVVKGSHVIVMGVTFKENCADIRNSRVFDLIRDLKSFGVNVTVHDPLADPSGCQQYYGVELTPWESLPEAAAIVVAVAHRQFCEMGTAQLLARLEPGGVVVDVKGMLDREVVSAAGATLWRL